MLPLRELQTGFRAALLDGDEHGLSDAIRADGIGEARLAVYRHHVFAALTAVLQATYPVVTLVGDPASSPMRPTPTSAGIRRRGRVCSNTVPVPDFLGAFPPCRDLV